MMASNDPRFESAAPRDDLGPDLAAAVAQARNRNPSPEMVTQLVARLAKLDGAPAPAGPPRQRSRWVGRLAGAAALVATVLVTATVRHRMRPRPPSLDPPLARNADFRNLSAVRRVSLVEAGFSRIAADLDHAQSQLDTASESLALAAVRRDVQETLEEYRHGID